MIPIKDLNTNLSDSFFSVDLHHLRRNYFFSSLFLIRIYKNNASFMKGKKIMKLVNSI